MRQSSTIRRSKVPKKLGMAPQRVLGICMLIIGILLAAGTAIHNANVDPGNTSGAARLGSSGSWYVLAGIGIALTGFILAVLGLRKRTRP